jgi:hypothetical protein
VEVEDDISDIPDDPRAAVQPIHFLATRMVKTGASALSQIKVQWEGYPKSLTTWEEAQDLHRRFPKCAAWGQAAFRGGGNVRNITKKDKKRKTTIGHPAIEKTTASAGSVG